MLSSIPAGVTNCAREASALRATVSKHEMSKPRPDPFELSELPALARLVIEKAKFPMLATLDTSSWT